MHLDIYAHVSLIVASSPVTVPRSRSRSSIGDSPNMKTVSASPLSTGVPAPAPSPPPVSTASHKCQLLHCNTIIIKYSIVILLKD